MTFDIVPPPVTQIRWHEMLKSAPLIVVLLYMHLHNERPITQFELSDSFEIDRKTAASYLRQMATSGMIVRVDHNSGYVLTTGGVQMLLELSTDGWGKTGHLPLKESLSNKDLKDLKAKKERSRWGKTGHLPADLTTERILFETSQLFSNATISFGIADRDPFMALATVAHAYDQRHKLKAPQVFVYRRLQNNVQPDRKYRIEPMAFLPNPYLAALGLAELKIVEVETIEPDKKTVLSAEIFSDETITEKLLNGWKYLLGQLEREMPKSSFDAWVRETMPKHFENGILKVGAKNQYACDWLESRLTSTVNRLLVGFMPDDKVCVEFVSVETEGQKS